LLDEQSRPLRRKVEQEKRSMYFAFGGFLELNAGLRHDICIRFILRRLRAPFRFAPRFGETKYVLHSRGLTIAVSAASRE
jgi:hypothetical protein